MQETPFAGWGDLEKKYSKYQGARERLERAITGRPERMETEVGNPAHYFLMYYGHDDEILPGYKIACLKVFEQSIKLNKEDKTDKETIWYRGSLTYFEFIKAVDRHKFIVTKGETISDTFNNEKNNLYYFSGNISGKGTPRKVALTLKLYVPGHQEFVTGTYTTANDILYPVTSALLLVKAEGSKDERAQIEKIW